MTAVSVEQGLGDLKLNGAGGATASPSTKKSEGTEGDGGPGDSEDEDDADDADDGKAATETTEGAAKKKKKRKPRKKKKAGAAGGGAKGQTSPPTVKVADLFPNNTFPVGEEVEYRDENNYRTTNEEKRHLDRMNQDFLTDYRHAAEVHRQVRRHAQSVIKPGMSLTSTLR